MTRRLSGWHVGALLVTFFGVVVAVNVTMATFAVRTFGGTVVENSYVASQRYNRWLEAARKQARLGWTIVPHLDAQRHVVVAISVPKARVTGFARHPLGRSPDVPLSFSGDHRSSQSLPAGRWVVHLAIRKGSAEARIVETLS